MASDFQRGFATPFRGFSYLRKHQHLWPFVLPAALVNVFITGAALAVLVVVAIILVAWVHPMFGDGFWAVVLEVVVIAAVVVVVLGLTLLCWMLMQNIIAGHLMSKLAERVERDLGVDADTIASVPFARQVTDGVLDTGLLLAINTTGLLIQFIPGVGAVIGVPLVFIGDAWVLGSDFLAHPLNLRGRTFSDRQRFLRRHWRETVGVGSAVAPLGLIPVLGGLVAACTVVGAVLLYRELEAEDAEEVEAAADAGEASG
ncbi:MAG: EI24 domain-containing protein [Planctomycetota bacterium]